MSLKLSFKKRYLGYPKLKNWEALLESLPNPKSNSLPHLKKKKKLTLFIYLFLAAVGVHCWEGFSLVAMSGGCTLVAVFRLLFLRAQALGTQASVACGEACGLQSTGSVVVAHRLRSSAARRLFPDQGSNLSPALASEFFTTEPPKKPSSRL